MTTNKHSNWIKELHNWNEKCLQTKENKLWNTWCITMVLAQRVFMWKFETQLFNSSYIWLPYIFETSYSTVATSVSKKSIVDQSELEIYVVSHCQMYYIHMSKTIQKDISCSLRFKRCIQKWIRISVYLFTVSFAHKNTGATYSHKH